MYALVLISSFVFSFFISFCEDDKDQKKSQKVLAELENIDDECDQNDIAFVKIDDDKEAAEWGIDEIPTIVSSFSVGDVAHRTKFGLFFLRRCSSSVEFRMSTKAI